MDTRMTRRGCRVPWLAAMLLAASCSGDSGGGETPPPDGAGRKMALQVSMTGASDDAASGVERMHDLRVVITRQEGGSEVLEYNRLVRFDDPEGRWKYGYMEDPRLMFRMEKAGRHHIYLFSNCEPVLEETLTTSGREPSTRTSTHCGKPPIPANSCGNS